MINNEQVKKMANLARLSLKEEEVDNFATQIANIMDMIDSLNEVDCTGVQPLTSVSDMNQRTRTDLATSNDISEELFSNVPGENADFAKQIKCFIVPKVIE